MDETRTRDHVQQHADAVVNGDMDAIVADFSEELRPQVPQIAQVLPKPVTSAEVLSVKIDDPVSVALIRYTGGTGVVTVRSEWVDEGGRPVIVRAAPADES
jgi:hypothetical protein